MVILGIDTSCDDTSASVVEEGVTVRSNIVSSQEIIHRRFGGIVPELASRRHVEMIWSVVDEALRSAHITLEDLSAVAVCHGPGLIGSLLVGCSFAKALCFSKGIPLVSVNHLEGHVFSSFLKNFPEGTCGGDEVSPIRALEFPFISLIVSGGHTSLYRIDGFGKYRELGRTKDDAAGEAYDKVSKLLGLGYPGGPVIDRLACSGNPNAVVFPRAYLPEGLDFSFSGLKTAVMNHLKEPHPHGINDIAASFQQAVIDVLVRKTEWAVTREGIHRVTVSGGVGANSALRKELALVAKEKGVQLSIPAASLCTDNAAMIAAAGYHHVKAHKLAPMDMNPVAYLPLS
ncbi:MAG TPA: tRNA (adenosine(37)-N6)-threonylcarbamoyltransferase complex transferase subunit TsaD [Thermodesulfovibrionales bacterium]|nr:tRNA (adenosine(37)-N6)-threonylcarbamoyltransferase complex transferase subunit TsaD [Thermodesulfovibrionales bacterium]